MKIKDVIKLENKSRFKSGNKTFSLFEIKLFDYIKEDNIHIDNENMIIIRAEILTYGLFCHYFNRLMSKDNILQINNQYLEDKASLYINNEEKDGIFFYPEYTFSTFESLNKDLEIYDLNLDENQIRNNILNILRGI